MLKSLVAFIVFLALTQQPLPLKGSQEQQQPQPQSDAAHPSTPSVLATNIEKENAANTERYAYYKAHKKEYLKAAFAPAYLSNWILAGLGLIGGFFALLTLSAIKRQANLMEDTAKRQLRAYLCVSQATLRFTKLGQITTQIYVKNAGQTPAYGVRAWGTNLIREHPLAAPLGRPSGESLMADGIIPPGGEHIMIVRSEVDLGSVYKPDHALYAYGECSFRDIYDVVRTLEYRLIWGGPAGTATQQASNGETVAMLCMDIDGNKEREENRRHLKKRRNKPN